MYIIVGIGTRGDVEPLCKFIQQIQSYSPPIVFFTINEYKNLVDSYNINTHYFASSIDYATIIQTNLSFNKPSIGRELYNAVYSLEETIVSELNEYISHNPVTMILSNNNSFVSILLSVKYNIPYVLISLSPFYISDRYKCLSSKYPIDYYFPSIKYKNLYDFIWKWCPQYSLSSYQNIFSHILHLYDRKKRYEKFEKMLDLSTNWILDSLDKHFIKVINCWEPTLFPIPTHPSVGFIFNSRNETYTPPLSLLEFVKSPCIYVGFGSMNSEIKTSIEQKIVLQLLNLNQRVILCTNQNQLSHPSLYVCHDSNHEWLFPKMKAVIFHGGCNTVAQVIKAKRPCLIVPFLYDQLLWGTILHEHFKISPYPYIPYQDSETLQQSLIQFVDHINEYEHMTSQLPNLTEINFYHMESFLQEVISSFRPKKESTIQSFLELSKQEKNAVFSMVYFYTHLKYNPDCSLDITDLSHLPSLLALNTTNYDTILDYIKRTYQL